MELNKKMKNKILIELVVPDIDEIYNVYIPINKRIGNIIILLAKAVSEFNLGEFEENNQKPIISIITTYYNDYRFIEQTAYSILQPKNIVKFRSVILLLTSIIAITIAIPISKQSLKLILPIHKF